MIATFCLFGCMLTPGQMPPTPIPALPVLYSPTTNRGGTWTLSPKLNRTQELVYHGQVREEANSSRVQFNRNYRLDLRVIVLEAGLAGYQTAFLTLLKTREPGPGATPKLGISDGTPSSARLEILRLDRQGKLIADQGAVLSTPLDGVPTLETGPFVPAPQEHLNLDEEWQVLETNRPPRIWRIVGTEMVNGTSCLKVVGNQQSDDWDTPRADRTAWKRQDSVWIAASQGYASRVERVIELREPARREPTQRSVLRYDLESSVSYPGALFENRRQEILQAHAFAENAAPLLRDPGKYGQQIGFLLTKITNHLDNQPATPYRDAILQLRRRLEAARRGETPPAMVPAAIDEQATVATPGYLAPDFLTTEFTRERTIRLRNYLGGPVLLLFYNPASETALDVLTFAQKLSTSHVGQLTVLPLSVSDDPKPALSQMKALNVTLPILSGRGLRISYGVETTPKIVLIDAQGIVRGSYLGWGRETPGEIRDELKNWLAEPSPTRSNP